MIKLRYKVTAVLLVCFFLALTIPREVHCQRLDLSSFLIDTQEDSLLARFSIDIDDFERIKTALDNGSKVALLCDVSLFRNRVLFWDLSLAGRQVEVGLEKDLLSGEYLIAFPGQKRRLINFEINDFHELFSDMNIELLPLDRLEPGQKYIVRIQVKLISKGVPKWIKRTLFFWNWDLARSIRYEMEFSL